MHFITSELVKVVQGEKPCVLQLKKTPANRKKTKVNFKKSSSSIGQHMLQIFATQMNRKKQPVEQI